MESDNNIVNGIIIGAAAAAIGTILAIKFLNHQSFGGGTPNQIATGSDGARGGVLYVQQPSFTEDFAAPLAQNTAITEAPYNTGDIGYEPAFHNNYAEHPALLPQ